MRNLVLIALLLGFFQQFSVAQPNGDRIRDRIRAQRVAIYTDVLKLSPEEAQSFWPIYNQFLDEREKIQDEFKSLRRDNLSDAEAEAQIKKHFELRQREIDLEKEMVQKLRKTISMQKIVKIPDAERAFRQTVLEKVKERADRRQERLQGN